MPPFLVTFRPIAAHKKDVSRVCVVCFFFFPAVWSELTFPSPPKSPVYLGWVCTSRRATHQTDFKIIRGNTESALQACGGLQREDVKLFFSFFSEKCCLFFQRINVDTETILKSLGSQMTSKFLYWWHNRALGRFGTGLFLKEFAFILKWELISFIADLSERTVTVCLVSPAPLSWNTSVLEPGKKKKKPFCGATPLKPLPASFISLCLTRKITKGTFLARQTAAKASAARVCAAGCKQRAKQKVSWRVKRFLFFFACFEVSD